MPYPENIEAKIGFQQVREWLQSRCLSPMGIYYAHRMKFTTRFDLLEKMLLQSREFHQLLTQDLPFPSDNYLDAGPCLYKARIEGFWLDEDELHQLRQVMQTFLQVSRYFRERPGTYPELESLLQGLLINDIVVRRIDRILDPEGKMKPAASPELAKLSAKIQEKETEIRRRIQKLFNRNQDLGYLADAIGITIREGRLVLPVLAEHKKHIPGFVHDESNTGQTVYIEPAECFDLNNLLRELNLAYRRERERILLEITDQIRPEIPELEKNLQRLGLFDFIRAKGILAIEMNAVLPIVGKHPSLKLVQAYHPMMKANHDKAGLKTVPLSLELNKEKHIMVISGPNAGGKSVCLKTVGLLQYMLQCGLLIPCAAHSEMGVYKEIMVDIGDEQSIENDLSTYSSHLLSMKNFCDFADGKTLFLIDEFGTGTDPQFGGPLAEAILHHLAQKRAQGIVTTHFSNLKNFASQHAGLSNACMLFDQDKMQPLYILEQGKPGSSYAFELAEKSGLSQQIINYAKNKVGYKQRKADDLLVELEKEKIELDNLRRRFAEKEEKAAALQARFEKLTAEIESNKKALIKKAKEEALSLITEANSRVEAVIREVREKKADTDSQKLARQTVKTEITRLKEEVKELQPEEEKEEWSAQNGDILPGDSVRIKGQEAIATVLEIKKNKALLAMGDLRSSISLSSLEKVLLSTVKSPPREMPKGIDLNHKMKNFQHELNLIGVRGEEAVRVLNDYLDDAVLLGVKQVRIVHGKGYGILRKLVREHLASHKKIASFSDEHIDFGGDGITLVTFHV